MKVLFICGCLEPGKDGVGDYTRVLASQLQNSGNEILLLALYDPYIKVETQMTQENQETSLEVLRYPHNYPHLKHSKRIRERIKQFDPLWISLQYVPYSFHTKGLNIMFPLLIRRLRGNYHWHLMIHEPWIPYNKVIGKNAVISHIQKYLLKLLIKKLDPKIIHTSNWYYQRYLERGGIESSLLLLPGNIPVVHKFEPQVLEDLKQVGIWESSRKNWIILGTFGRMRSDINYLSLFEDVLAKFSFSEKRILFISIGFAGADSSNILQKIKKGLGDKIQIYKMGERSPAEISSVLQMLDYGVASVPKHLLGKSGAYAAMRHHRIRILVPENEADRQKNFWRQSAECSEYLLNIPDEEFFPSTVALRLLNAFNDGMHPTLKISKADEDIIFNA